MQDPRLTLENGDLKTTIEVNDNCSLVITQGEDVIVIPMHCHKAFALLIEAAASAFESALS